MASGQKVAAAKALGIVEQTLANWVNAEKTGPLRRVKSAQVSTERMESNRLRAELARVTMDLDILHPIVQIQSPGAPVWETPRPTSRRCSDEVRPYSKEIEKHKLLWPVCVQCRVLSVSSSGYRQHWVRKKKIFMRRHLSETALLVEIRAVYAEARGAYGWPASPSQQAKALAGNPGLAAAKHLPRATERVVRRVNSPYAPASKTGQYLPMHGETISWRAAS